MRDVAATRFALRSLAWRARSAAVSRDDGNDEFPDDLPDNALNRSFSAVSFAFAALNSSWRATNSSTNPNNSACPKLLKIATRPALDHERTLSNTRATSADLLNSYISVTPSAEHASPCPHHGSRAASTDESGVDARGERCVPGLVRVQSV